MSAIIRLIKAFAVGAVAGLVGQILLSLVSLLVPVPAFATLIAMLIFGVISYFVISSGLYARVARFGGNGAAIPLCGLMFGAAMARAGAEKSGSSAGKAFGVGFWAILKVLGPGFIIAFVLGLFWMPSGGIAPAVISSPILPFIFAMLIGGAICLVTQLLSDCKIPFPIVAIFMVALGGILTPLGVIDWLGSLGAGGASVTAMGCGNGAYGAGISLIMGDGLTLVLVAALNLILVAIGSLAGGRMGKRHPECLPPPPAQEQAKS